MIYKIYLRIALGLSLAAAAFSPLSSASTDGAALKGHGICHLSHEVAFREGYKTLSEKIHGAKQMVVIASFSAKPLHNLLGDGGSVEHVSQVLSFFFQKHMHETLAGIVDLNVTGAASSFFKTVRLQLETGDNSQVVLQSIAANALNAAIDDTVSYLDSPGGAAEKAIQTQMRDAAAFGFTPTFSENQTRIISLDPSVLNTIRLKLRTAYPGSGALKAQFSLWYSVGAGLSNVDANAFLKVRYSQIKGNMPAVIFDPVRLKKELELLIEQRARLAWLFHGKSRTEVGAIFALIRQNLDVANTRDFSPEFKRLLQGAPGLKPNCPDIDLLRPFAAIEDYVRRLNILDYLREERLVGDPNAREAFSRLPNPKVILLIDLKNISAGNMLIMHSSLDRLLNALKVLESQISTWMTLGDSASEAMALSALKAFSQAREDLLLPTDTYIHEFRQQIILELMRIGLKSENFVLWTSGDDKYLVANQDDISGEAIATRLTMMLGAPRRVAYKNIKPGTPFILFDAARMMLGPLADVLKFVEKLHPDYAVTAEGGSLNHQNIRVHRVDGSHRLSEVDYATLALLQETFVNVTITTGGSGPF